MQYDWLVNTGEWLLVSGVRAVLIIGAAVIVQLLLINVSRKLVQVLLSTKLGEDADDRQKRIATITTVLVRLANMVIWSVAAVMLLAELGVNIAPVLAGAGIVGIAIGLGAQDVIKNFLHGILIVLEDQYAEGDKITVAGVTGIVVQLDLRRTVLRDETGAWHHIPNGLVTVATNHSRSVL